MSYKVYVGNLPWVATDASLRQLFEAFGVVLSAEVLVDRRNGRPRGFGFVRMESSEARDRAIFALDGMHYHGRQIKVAIAKELPDNRRSSPGLDDTQLGERRDVDAAAENRLQFPPERP